MGRRFLARLRADRRYRTLVTAVLALTLNLAFAAYHGALGIATASVWFGASSGYYLLLSTMRFAAVLHGRGKRREQKTILALTGGLLTALAPVLALMLTISLRHPVATRYGTITMITIATFTFTKIGLAIRRALLHRGHPSPRLAAIRGIGYAEVAVSVATMQRSMLVSFEGMTRQEIDILNLFTGTAVCAFTLWLGIGMLRKAYQKENTHGKIQIDQGE